MSASPIASYACDRCRSRKISCSRKLPKCEKCEEFGIQCTYSRAGVIRRRRRQKQELPLTPVSDVQQPSQHKSATASSRVELVESHLSKDIETTRRQLSSLGPLEHNALSALTSLADTSAAVWHDAVETEMQSKTYFLFEHQSAEWVDMFKRTLEEGAPLFLTPPQEVWEALRACEPEKIHQRAWLVMYYACVLSVLSSKAPDDHDTKSKLRCNLWLAMNDVRLLLEPSEANIQALMLLACHVEEFTTPALCWMLVSNACRMLQALGIQNRHLDYAARERRFMLFWHLNLLDKGLAIIFGRPPTFHKAAVAEVPKPTLQQLMKAQPHIDGPEAKPTQFGAHFYYQNINLSFIIDDIWMILYGTTSLNKEMHGMVIERLLTWHGEASSILNAAAMTEKPFMSARGMRSIDLGIAMVEMNFQHLLILLYRPLVETRAQCVDASKRMLAQLKLLVSDSLEVFNGIVWQLICCPFTAFLVLFGEIISGVGNAAVADCEGALRAMQMLPDFLQQMAERNSLAAKMEHIARKFVDYASSVLRAKDMRCTPVDTGNLTDFTDIEHIGGSDFDFSAYFSQQAWDASMNEQMHQEPGVDVGDHDFLRDAAIDWMGWGSLV